MAKGSIKITITTKFRWWLRPCLFLLAIFSVATNTKISDERLANIVYRGTKITFSTKAKKQKPSFYSFKA